MPYFLPAIGGGTGELKQFGYWKMKSNGLCVAIGDEVVWRQRQGKGRSAYMWGVEREPGKVGSLDGSFLGLKVTRVRRRSAFPRKTFFSGVAECR